MTKEDRKIGRAFAMHGKLFGRSHYYTKIKKNGNFLLAVSGDGISRFATSAEFPGAAAECYVPTEWFRRYRPDSIDADDTNVTMTAGGVVKTAPRVEFEPLELLSAKSFRKIGEASAEKISTIFKRLGKFVYTDIDRPSLANLRFEKNAIYVSDATRIAAVSNDIAEIGKKRECFSLPASAAANVSKWLSILDGDTIVEIRRFDKKVGGEIRSWIMFAVEENSKEFLRLVSICDESRYPDVAKVIYDFENESFRISFDVAELFAKLKEISKSQPIGKVVFSFSESKYDVVVLFGEKCDEGRCHFSGECSASKKLNVAFNLSKFDAAYDFVEKTRPDSIRFAGGVMPAAIFSDDRWTIVIAPLRS